MPAVGLAAFSLVLPITVALLVMLGLLILSYRQTIKAYPSAGGAYLVTRDNFGIVPAQVAGASLLVGYILTVAVSVSAGTAALISAFEALTPYRVPISLAFIGIVMYGNLRGVKESGKVFAVPTYFFMLNMGALLAWGFVQYLSGDLDVISSYAEGTLPIGEATADTGLYLGAGAFLLAKAFASGGSAVTGVEAISNGVPAFKEPAWRNARQTLVLMGSGLGVMFLGLSLLASKVKVIPFEDGTPTVLAQIGESVYGAELLGDALSYSLQASTMLILVLAANTGFADFPRLASFQAGDSFLPRQLTKRGHRLVFSNGILALAGSAGILVVATGAEVTRLIPLYNKEADLLEHDVPAAATAPILRRHVVLVFIDRLDMAAARAIQYARTLTPDEMRAVHFAVDELKAEELAGEWSRTGLQRVPLEIVACPDRRLTRSAVECVARELANGETEVSVLLPDRKYRGLWHRVLHDKTADSILDEVSRLPHANVTSVPFHLNSLDEPKVPLSALTGGPRGVRGTGAGREQPQPLPGPVLATEPDLMTVAGCTQIGDARWRNQVRIAGRVRSIRVAPLHDAPTLELVLVDGTGAVSVVFLGRRSLAGVGVGTRMSVEGTVGVHKARLAILNPAYQLVV